MRSILIYLILSSFIIAKNIINASMVISGGISLGAYEAGYNWAIINLLKKVPQYNNDVSINLNSVAGASAGSINALLSAIYWCQKDDIKNSVDNNLFYDTWLNIDINNLIIKGEDKNNYSTLFTRKSLIKSAQNILQHMKKPIYKKMCSVPLGVMVTKANPIVENYQGMKIKNQSFAIPLIVKEQNNKLTVKTTTLKYNKHYLYTLNTYKINTNMDYIIKILFASSAFPGAFKQVKLDYIYKGKKDSDNFLDGGVYNNIPLDLAVALAPNSKDFIFIAPNNLRDFDKKNCKNKNIQKYLHCNSCNIPKFINSKKYKDENELSQSFLHTNLLPLIKSAEIFRAMKLYETINRYFRGNPNKNLILSSRYHPITGNFMWAFGAFLDRNFREYDYYVGVYDAIYKFAKEAKKRGYSKLDLPILMDRYKKILKLDTSKDASYVYNMLQKAEFCNKIPNDNSKYSAIYRAFNIKLVDENRYSFKEFKKFLTKLDTSNMNLNQNSFLSHAIEEPNNWYKDTAQVIIDRVSLLENHRAKIEPDYTPIARTVDFSAWLSMSKLKSKNGLEFQPLFIPDYIDSRYLYLYTILPNEFAFDNINGGFSLGYSLYWYEKFAIFDGIEFKLSYNHSKHIDDNLRLDIDPYMKFKKSFYLGVGVSIFANLQNRPFWERDNAFGANMYIDYNNIFRFTYVRRFKGPNKNYLYFGIKNIPSLIYWLNR